MKDEKQSPKSGYDAIRQYLKVSLEMMIAGGRNIREFTNFALEKFGDNFYPYLHEFYEDIRKGRIRIKGLTETARMTLFGHHISPAEREERIRRAAYARAEERGFQEGSEIEDWYSAEKQVDEQLEKEAGLIDKGYDVISTATTIVDKEFENLKNIVKKWLKMQEKAGEKTRHKSKHKNRRKQHKA
jgi:hypothetical protein